MIRAELDFPLFTPAFLFRSRAATCPLAGSSLAVPEPEPEQPPRFRVRFLLAALPPFRLLADGGAWNQANDSAARADGAATARSSISLNSSEAMMPEIEGARAAGFHFARQGTRCPFSPVLFGFVRRSHVPAVREATLAMPHVRVPGV